MKECLSSVSDVMFVPWNWNKTFQFEKKKIYHACADKCGSVLAATPKEVKKVFVAFLCASFKPQKVFSLARGTAESEFCEQLGSDLPSITRIFAMTVVDYHSVAIEIQ